MSIRRPKGAARTVVPRSKGLSEADVPGGLPKKRQEKRARNQAAVADSATKPKAVKLHADDMLRFLRENPVPDQVAGIPNEKAVLDAIARTAKDFEGRTITVDQFVGRLWERLMLRAPSVHGRLAGPLNAAIEMQSYFVKYVHSSFGEIDPKTGRWHGGTGFFDANGNNVYLTDGGRASLIELTKGLGAFASADPKALAKKGLLFADRFRIGGKEYVDGAILMPFAGRYIVLLRVEAKTKFSGGVDSQLGAFFVRLASSRSDQKIECYIDGVRKDVDRHLLLFNPTWTDSGVGVQEWDQNLDLWKDARAWNADAMPARAGGKPPSAELGERLDRAANRLQRLPSDQRSAFVDGTSDAGSLDQLTALAVSGPTLMANADMRSMRSWLVNVVIQASRR